MYTKVDLISRVKWRRIIVPTERNPYLLYPRFQHHDVNKTLKVVLLFITLTSCCQCFTSRNDWNVNDSLSLKECKGWESFQMETCRKTEKLFFKSADDSL